MKEKFKTAHRIARILIKKNSEHLINCRYKRLVGVALLCINQGRIEGYQPITVGFLTFQLRKILDDM